MLTAIIVSHTTHEDEGINFLEPLEDATVTLLIFHAMSAMLVLRGFYIPKD